MSADVRRLYHESLLDHYRHPRNAEPLDDPDAIGESANVACGDRSVVSIRTGSADTLRVSVETRGCSVAVATGSMLAQALDGRVLEEARALVATVAAFLETSHADAALAEPLAPLHALSDFPTRRGCALVPCRAAQRALSAVPPRPR